MKPESNEAVRGWVYVGGWYLENLGENQCRATLILEMNLKGNVPGFAIRGTNVVQGAQLKRMSASMDNYILEQKGWLDY